MTEYNHQEDEPMISDTALDDPALRDLFVELGALADRPTPPVGDELAALFAGATPLAAARTRRNKAAKTGLIGLVTAGVLAGGVTAAAGANVLPSPAQRIVSRVINTLTPLEIPNPDEQGPVEHQTNINDDGDQPGQDDDRPGQDVDQPGQDGAERGDQSGGQEGSSGGDQSGDNRDGGVGGHGDSDGGADQQGSGQETTSGITGESGETGTSGNDVGADPQGSAPGNTDGTTDGSGGSGLTGTSGNGSGASGTSGGQQGTNGSGQN